MKKVKGLTNRIAAMLMSGMLVVGAVPGIVPASENQSDIGQTSEIAAEVPEGTNAEDVSAEKYSGDAVWGYEDAAEDPEQGDVVQGEAAQDDVTQGEAAQDDVVQGEAAQDDVVQGAAAQDDVTQGETVQEELPEEDLPEEEASDAARTEIPAEVSEAGEQVLQERDPDESPVSEAAGEADSEQDETDHNEEPAESETEVSSEIIRQDADTKDTEDVQDIEAVEEIGTESVSGEKKSADTTSKVPGSTWLNDISPDQTSGYYYDNDELIEKIDSTFYSKAVEFDASYDTFAVYKLNKSYNTFTGTVCTGKSTGSGVFSLSVYGDGELIHEISGITNDNNYKSFDLDVSGVTELKIQTDNSGSWADGWVYIADGLLRKNDVTGISSFPLLEYEGHFYQVIDQTISFSDAEEICKDAGGHLASVTSEGENQAICDYLSSNNVSAAMVGLYGENGVSGPWDTWCTGEAAVYQNWQSGQPDEEGQHICVIQTDSSGYYGVITPGQWDNGWDGDYYFVCEWDNAEALSGEVIKIYTADDLKGISNNLSGSYLLMEDINLARIDWEPIGSSSVPFVGNFNGNGHVISNLWIQDPGEYQGLFGMTDGAVITRVTVSGIINGRLFAGGISGYSRNTEITYCINKTMISGADQIGGIVGRLEGGSVDYCMNTSPITASARGCGGITADVYPSGAITNCLNLGNVWGGTDLTGGIAGGSTECNIASCVNAAIVSCQSGRVGAIAGDNAYYAGSRVNNYFIQNNDIPNNYSVEGSDCGTFSSVGDDRVKDLKKKILSGNGIDEISLEDLVTPSKCTLVMDDSYTANAGEEIEISAEIESEVFTPAASNMSWTVEPADQNNVEIGDMVISESSTNTYILSSVFKFTKNGKYTVTLKTDQGDEASTVVSVDLEKLLKITPSSTKPGSVYAGDLSAEKTFTATLEEEDDRPEKSDFLFDLKRADSLTSVPSQELADSAVQVKDIKKLSDRKYEITFAYKPDETGFYGLTISYKDNVDDTELMVYDSNILEKLEKDPDKTLNTYYKQYCKKIKAELGRLAKESDEKTDYMLKAQELKKTSSLSLLTDAIADEDVDLDSLNLCAYETLARYYDKYGKAKSIHFDEVDNDTAASMITQNVAKYIGQGYGNNLKNVRLDSMAEIGGKSYHVNATTNILLGFEQITLKIQDQSRDGRLFLFYCYDKKAIETQASDYIKALRELFKSSLNNAARSWYKDFSELLGWDIKKDIDKDIEDYRNELSKDIVDGMEKHGIKNLLDNIKTCRNYYKQIKGTREKLQNAVTVMKSGKTSLYDKAVSLNEIRSIKLNTLESGDCAEDVYNLLKEAQEKSRDYMVEYFTTGTIKELETENLGNTIGNFINKFKCPVSVTVLDPSGQAVGYVGDDDIWFNDPVYIEENGDEKIIYTPRAAGYHFNVTGTDYGLVSYTVQELINGEPSGEYCNYFDIPVEKGSDIQVEILKDSVHSADDVSVIAEEITCQPEIADQSSAINVHVNNDSDKGAVTGAGSYHLGDMASLCACPSDGYYFAGWYEGSVLKSSLEEYRFEVRQDIVLTPAWLYMAQESGESEALPVLSKPVKTGSCGLNCFWTYCDNGDLIISGTGAMTYSSTSSSLYWNEYKPDIKTVIINKGVTSIAERAFSDCTSLSRVIIPEGITEIESSAFRNCTSLTSVIIPSTVTRILTYSFHGCTGLESVQMPEGIEIISGRAFSGCSSLSSVTIPSSLIRIESSAFSECNNLRNVNVSENVTRNFYSAFKSTPWISSMGDFVIVNDILWRYKGNESHVVIPSGVKAVGDTAFDNYSDLESVTIPATVKSIGACAFRKCTGLNSVIIPGNVETINSQAFLNCTSLENVEIRKGVTKIGEDAFKGCRSLTNITIPSSVNSIGKRTFWHLGDNGYDVLKDMIISGFYNSYAEQYARENGYTFRTFIIDAAVKVPEQSYTGKSLVPVPEVGFGNKTLTKNIDYTVSYTNNTNVGTATVTITGKGNYTGRKTVTFKINKADQSVTAKAKASSVAVGKTTTVSITGAKGKKSYKSSNTAIATVTSAGKVTVKKVGTVKITAASAATANYKAASKTVTIKAVPAATASLTAANQSTGIKLTWKKVTGADGYKVYRGSTRIKTITSGSTVTFADAKANTNGSKYTYKVVAKASTGDSTLSKSVSVYRVARPAVSSVTNSASRKMTVKWGKNAKATGCQIQYSTDKTFKSGNKAVTITSASTVSRVIGSLTKGKTYYVRIRTYKTVGSSKYWSVWSSVRSVKISK